MSHSHKRWLGITLPLFLALSLSLALFLVSNAQVDEPGSVTLPVFRYVATTGDNNGNDCTSSASPCATLQHAVAVADAQNEIRVAEGVYAGTQLFTRTLYNKVYSYTQVLYINKSLTVRGGFSAGDWGSSEPEAHPTVIDAQRAGRGVTIIDTLDDPVTLDGFTITGGDYTGLGNPFGVGNYVCGYTSSDCGGGILVARSAVNLQRLKVWDNIGGLNHNEGGGIYLDHARTISIEDSLIISNSADYGGGMFVDDQSFPVTIHNSVFQENTAYGTGGGIDFGNGIDGLVTIEHSEILSNTAVATFRGDGDGGGIYVRMAKTGLVLQMNRVKFQNNRGEGSGMALFLDSAGPFTPTARLDNLLLTGNGRVTGSTPAAEDAVIAVGPGFTNLNAYFAHVTAADNDAGGFLFAEPDRQGIDLVQVVLTNTLLSGFDNAFIARETAPGQVTVAHDNTLLHNVSNMHLILSGSPGLTATNPISGDPLLDASYHLQSGSDAIDAGIEAGVSDDIDGQFRPQAAGPDIGADEFLTLVAPATLAISGPDTVVANTDNTFLAELGPIDATRPLTYVWSATGLTDVIHHTGNLSDTVSFSWPTTGAKSVSLTVYNSVSSIGDSHPVTVISAPALTISKSGPAEAVVGSTITYELTVANNGVSGATSLVVTDTVPANVTSVTPLDGGTVVGGDTVQWNLASLAGGGASTVRFQVSAGQTIVNDDYAVQASGGYSAVGSTAVTTVFGQPQLAIGKSGPPAAAPGQDIVYQLTISNTGTITATGVVVSDTLPAGATYLGGGQLIGDVVRWEIDSIPAGGEPAQVNFTVSANATITNDDYQVTADGGFGAQGAKSVSTIIGAGTRYVAASGSDGLNNCTNSAAPCATIQHAVTVANSGEEVRVASGTYNGPQTVSAADGNNYKQVVFVNKGLSLLGGYTTADWNNADPLANVTIIDAQRSGRGVTILDTANDTVTVEGFTITGGDYTGLGNPAGVDNEACEWRGFDCGGGLFIHNSAVTLRSLTIHDNIASTGDGTGGNIYMWKPRAVTIEATVVSSGTANNGGGLYLSDTVFPIAVTDVTFSDNVAEQGGGVFFAGAIDHLVSFSGGQIISNTALTEEGGGMYARMTEAGVILHMDRVRLQNNQAYGQGKALFLDSAGPETPTAVLSNLLFSGNRRTGDAPVTADEAVLAVNPQSSKLIAKLFHISAADNPLANFLYAEPRQDAGYFVTVALTNTLLSGFDNAFAAKEVAFGEATIQHTKTLSYNVLNQHLNLGGTPSFTAVDPISGDPKLNGTYHLTAGSAAIDVAAETGITVDIDGDSRPLGDGPDIGADEYVPAPPAAFGKSSPADSATGQSTSPILSWSVSSGAASYEICYDTSNNDSCDGVWTGAGDSTTKALTGLASGTTYYWQVRAVNSLASVEADGGSWWSFTTGAAPGAFNKSSPANGAGSQPISPLLSWTASSGAATYAYCLDTSNNGACDDVWTDVGDVTETVPGSLSHGTTYYWQVRAVNSFGHSEANGGSWWVFTTGNLPGAFAKSGPADQAIDQPTSLSLTWGNSNDATTYEYCFDTIDNEDCDDVWTGTGGNTSAAISGLNAGTTYYWQVRAVNSLGHLEADGWSWWSFSTASPPAAFGKSAPADGAINQSTSPTLSWAASAHATSYEYCFDTTDDDSCDGSWISAGANTSVAQAGLYNDTTYYWQVRAVNGLATVPANGGTWWSFTTEEAPYKLFLPLTVVD